MAQGHFARRGGIRGPPPWNSGHPAQQVDGRHFRSVQAAFRVGDIVLFNVIHNYGAIRLSTPPESYAGASFVLASFCNRPFPGLLVPQTPGQKHHH